MAETEHVYHRPVLGLETLEYLAPVPEGCYVDCTAGGGGHCQLLLDRLGPAGRCVALDRDPDAIAHLESRFRGDPRLVIRQGTFTQARLILNQLGLARVNGFLFDLGVSSHQFDTAGRGFSYRMPGPLDMRMDPGHGEPVSRLLEKATQPEVAHILYTIGQVHASRRIAAKIAGVSLRTTADLSRCVERALGHPVSASLLSKIFMALRIWVNHEFEELAAGLQQALGLLAPDGRIVVISYHSGEDRIVKNWMRDRSRSSAEQDASSAGAQLLTRKPVWPGEAEVRDNPRARSARLRALKAVAGEA